MVVLVIVPIGYLQLHASVESDFWFARTREFYQTPVVRGLLWFRLMPDLIFIVGALRLTRFLVRGLGHLRPVSVDVDPAQEAIPRTFIVREEEEQEGRSGNSGRRSVRSGAHAAARGAHGGSSVVGAAVFDCGSPVSGPRVSVRGRVAPSRLDRYSLCMKRTNLVLDEALLEEATRLSGEKTYSRAVERALQEFVRRIKARQILTLAGTGLWEGDLSSMRRDSPRSNRRGR